MQGDGEVNGTAIEASLTGTFQFIVHKGAGKSMFWPRAEDADFYYTMGMDLDLDVAMPQWYGLLAPAGLPADIRKAFEAQVLAMLRSPEVVKQLATSGVADPKGTVELQAILDADFKKWPALVAEARDHCAIRRIYLTAI